MILEHERAILLVDLPEYDLAMGDVGTVVHVYSTGQAYEIEFFTMDGQTLDVVTVNADQVRPVTHRDILHARVLETSD